jgi:hypothetical protein
VLYEALFCEGPSTDGQKPPFSASATWSAMGLVPLITQIALCEARIALHISEIAGTWDMTTRRRAPSRSDETPAPPKHLHRRNTVAHVQP